MSEAIGPDNGSFSSACDHQFRVLLVCTANMCRSRLAEAYLRHGCEVHGVDWAVRSVGLNAATGGPSDSRIDELIKAREVPLSPWPTTAVSLAALAESNLILTATHDHRAEVARRLPRAVGKTFTLVQFRDYLTLGDPLCAIKPSGAGETMLAAARTGRQFAQPKPPNAYDIEDPYGRPLATYRACDERIHSAVTDILSHLDSDSPH